jgi:hypothetical protein
MQGPPEFLLKLQTWEATHPYGQLVFVAVLAVFICLFTLAAKKIRTVRALVWSFVALSFFIGLIRISIEQPLLGFIAAIAAAGILVLLLRKGGFTLATSPFRKITYRRSNDGSKSPEYFRNIKNGILGFWFVVCIALVIFGLIMALIHGHK